jgi:hypothetical protein
MASMEIQNLRIYDHRGLIDPHRTPAGTRLHPEADLARLVVIRELLAEGLNLAGGARVIELETRVARLQANNNRPRTRTPTDLPPPGVPNGGSTSTPMIMGNTHTSARGLPPAGRPVRSHHAGPRAGADGLAGRRDQQVVHRA